MFVLVEDDCFWTKKESRTNFGKIRLTKGGCHGFSFFVRKDSFSRVLYVSLFFCRTSGSEFEPHHDQFLVVRVALS